MSEMEHCVSPLWRVALVVFPVVFLRPPTYHPCPSLCPFPRSRPYLTHYSSCHAGSSFLIFPSCRTEKSKEQNWEDRGHRADMQAKRSEPLARKVTLIEVRENQQSQEWEKIRRKSFHYQGKTRCPSEQWQMPGSTTNVMSFDKGIGICGQEAVSSLGGMVDGVLEA